MINIEIEKRYRVKSVASITSLLEAAGYSVLRPQAKESVEFYDSATANFRAKEHYFRLTEGKGFAVLTHKSANMEPFGEFKMRREVETEISDAAATREMLERIGLRKCGYYSLTRSVWQKDKVKVVLDRTSLGSFVEIESRSEQAINRAARELGVQKNTVLTESYCRYLGVPC